MTILTEGDFLSVGIDKAFDNVDHCFLFSILISYRFGKEYITWVRTLLHNIGSGVMNTLSVVTFNSIEELVREIRYGLLFKS